MNKESKDERGESCVRRTEVLKVYIEKRKQRN